MKRCAALLAAALLAVGVAGCQPIPEERRAVLGDVPNVNASRQGVPSDRRIEGKKLTDAERNLIDFVTTDSVSMFYFRTDPAWEHVEFWMEPYLQGERQPAMSLGGFGFVTNDAAEGDILIKVPRSMDSYAPEIAIAKQGKVNARLYSNHHPYPIADIGASTHWQLEDPTEIREGEDIVLRVDSYGVNGVVGPIVEDNVVDADILERTAYVLVLKCRFTARTPSA